MELSVNDLSLHGQFRDTTGFKEAVSRVMAMRSIAFRFDREIYCHRNLGAARITPTMSMYQALQLLSMDQKRSISTWLTKQGPFWEDTRTHSENDYIECKDEVVTNTSLGEAAYCWFNGISRNLVSFTPSDWSFSPITAKIVPISGNDIEVQIANYFNQAELEIALQKAEVPISSWKQLELGSKKRFSHICFSDDCFAPLYGHPFSDGASQRILALLDILDRIKASIDQSGQLTAAGQELYQDYFVGEKARFSDSSDSEKNDFKAKLTFRHPREKGGYLFCPWHGKIKTPQFRIHFSFPIQAKEPLYIVYIGPKITVH